MLNAQFQNAFDQKRGSVGLGLIFLIMIVIAFVVLVVLSGALRTYIIGGFNFFGSLVNKINGQTRPITTATTVFLAYDCSYAGCAKFVNATPYNTSFWYVDFNGHNLSATLLYPIYFTSAIGNYSFVVYNITAGPYLLCPSLSFHSGSASAGSANIIDYSQNYCP